MHPLAAPTLIALSFTALAVAGPAGAAQPCPSHTDRARGLRLRLSRPAGEQACRQLELVRVADGKRLASQSLPADRVELGVQLGPARAGKLLLRARYDFWVFDLVDRKLTGPYAPCVPEGQDAQSGNLQQLGWLADHLVAGRAVDRGRFVFALDGEPRELVPTASARGESSLDYPEGHCLSLFTDPGDLRMLGLLDDRLAFRDRRLMPAKVLIGHELGGCRPRRPVPAPARVEVFDAADRLRGVIWTERGRKLRRKLVFDPLAGKLLTLTSKTPVATQLAQQAKAVALRLWQGRRYAQAADQFALALALAPDKVAWRLQLAAVLVQAARPDDAVRALAAAARQNRAAARKVLRTKRVFAPIIQRPEVKALLTGKDPVYPAPAALPGAGDSLTVHPIGWSKAGTFAWAEWRPPAGAKAGELSLHLIDVAGERPAVHEENVPPAGSAADFAAAWAARPADWNVTLVKSGILPALGVEALGLPARTAIGIYTAWYQPGDGGQVALMVNEPGGKPRALVSRAMNRAQAPPPIYLKNPFGDQRVLLAVLPADAEAGTTQRLSIHPI